MAIAEKIITPEAALGQLASLLLLYCSDHHHFHKIKFTKHLCVLNRLDI